MIHYFIHSEYGVGKWLDAYQAETEHDAAALARDNHEGRKVSLTYLGEFQTVSAFEREYPEAFQTLNR